MESLNWLGASAARVDVLYLAVCEQLAQAPFSRFNDRSWHETDMPSWPREFHPQPLTDLDLILSHHPARAID